MANFIAIPDARSARGNPEVSDQATPGFPLRLWRSGMTLGLAVLAFTSRPATALEFSTRGDVMTLRGPIRDGDDALFREALGGGVRVVNLNSGGGKIQPASEIARLIRSKGLTTVTDASSALCASACTVIFAGGRQRYYLNAGNLTEGAFSKTNFRGLGFHEGNDPLSREKNHYSGRATANMINMYYEMGISAASSLATKAPPEQYYRISGPTALSFGIATSLSRP